MKKTLYKPLGFLCLGLGLLGIPLPLLPSTPFILLAAWLFARSSPRWHRWLLASELFGPVIRNWEDQRCLSCRTKVVALSMMVLAGGASIVFALDHNGLRLATAILMLIGGLTILRIRTCEGEDAPASGADGVQQ